MKDERPALINPHDLGAAVVILALCLGIGGCCALRLIGEAAKEAATRKPAPTTLEYRF